MSIVDSDPLMPDETADNSGLTQPIDSDTIILSSGEEIQTEEGTIPDSADQAVQQQDKENKKSKKGFGLGKKEGDSSGFVRKTQEDHDTDIQNFHESQGIYSPERAMEMNQIVGLQTPAQARAKNGIETPNESRKRNGLQMTSDPNTDRQFKKNEDQIRKFYNSQAGIHENPFKSKRRNQMF